ncbi:hypothetical protein [Pseudomonas sp. GL-R-26]|uniref:hypothetical protein n=1 Tax=Pseudomonas sp. GL-R-26 TaxID=2832392 RepID=UPI001CC1B74C|nr:hypothetical protein [Pseudomonas sp. GL-R-26]
MSEQVERYYKIMVYGAEQKYLKLPDDVLKAKNFEIHYCPLKALERFNDYDGVVVFNQTFESFEVFNGSWGESIRHRHNSNEMDKRQKELQLLQRKGGFVCFLMDDSFIDNTSSGNYQNTDLSKVCLNKRRLHRENYRSKVHELEVKSDDFRTFLNTHGVASSFFSDHYHDSEIKVIATDVAGRCVAMQVNRNEFYLPAILPVNSHERINEYFNSLISGLTSCYSKLAVEIPDWVKAYPFVEDEQIEAETEALNIRILELESRRQVINVYKSTLLFSGDDLVSSVAEVFRSGFKIEVDALDDLREDLKLLDENGKIFCLCEIKGTNRGITREFINQTDSHRERSGLGADFSAVLIVNGNIKNSKTIVDKEVNQEIASDQIKHAVKMNVLIFRTIDLLNLLNSFVRGHITRAEVLQIFKLRGGWYKCTDNERGLLVE